MKQSELDETKRLMGALVRMKPKPHEKIVGRVGARTSSLRAKRSNPARGAALDCFVASLLAMTKLFIVTDLLTLVTDNVTQGIESRLMIRTRPGRHSWIARASAAPAGGLATRARAALGIIPSALRPGRVLHAGLRDRQGRVTPAQRADHCPPRPRKPGLRLSPLR